VSTKNTGKPDSWKNVAIITSSLAFGLRTHIARWGAEWHLKNRPRRLPVELVDALSATSVRTFVAGLPRPIRSMTQREMAEHTAEHIRRVDPVVVRMLEAFSDGPRDAQVPESLELVFWTLKNATDAVVYVEHSATAHDAAMDELFNPEGQA
jgi:hypothetical protein